MDRPPVNSAMSIRWRRPPKLRYTPRCTRPSRFNRSPTPAWTRRSTVVCSSTPARTRLSMYSRLRASRMTDSIPSRCNRCASSKPAGPAPMMPTWVRIPSLFEDSDQFPVADADGQRHQSEDGIGGCQTYALPGGERLVPGEPLTHRKPEVLVRHPKRSGREDNRRHEHQRRNAGGHGHLYRRQEQHRDGDETGGIEKAKNVHCHRHDEGEQYDAELNLLHGRDEISGQPVGDPVVLHDVRQAEDAANEQQQGPRNAGADVFVAQDTAH